MAEITFPREFELDWDDIAINDGTSNVKAPTYGYVLEDFDNENSISGNIDSIRYSPEVNSAPSITIDLPPRDEIDGLTYLGGELTVYVDGDFLFNGDIVVIDTVEKEGESYSIKARSKGKRMDGEVIDETPENVILQDFLAKTIDRYNRVQAEAFEYANTDDEVLDNILKVSDVIRRPDGNSGTITYNGEINNGQFLRVIQIKATIDESLTVRMLNENGGVEYSETINELEFSQYGTWVPIVTPIIQYYDPYDIQFELNGPGTILYDWVFMSRIELNREVVPFETEVVDNNLVVQNLNTSSDFIGAFDL